MDLSCKTSRIILLAAACAGAIFVLWIDTPPEKSAPTNSAEKVSGSTYATTTVTIGTTTIIADIADTPEKRRRGLSGRKTLPSNRGMLFVFPDSQIRTFWMKDMHFPIDIIWIDAQKHVTSITRTATPDSYPQTFSPLEPAQYVLETNTDVFSNISPEVVVHMP